MPYNSFLDWLRYNWDKLEDMEPLDPRIIKTLMSRRGGSGGFIDEVGLRDLLSRSKIDNEHWAWDILNSMNEEPPMGKKNKVQSYDLGDLMSAIRSVVEDAYDDVMMEVDPDDLMKVDVVSQITTKAMAGLQSLIKAQGLSKDLVQGAVEKIASSLAMTPFSEKEDLSTTIKKSVLTRIFCDPEERQYAYGFDILGPWKQLFKGETWADRLMHPDFLEDWRARRGNRPEDEAILEKLKGLITDYYAATQYRDAKEAELVKQQLKDFFNRFFEEDETMKKMGVLARLFESANPSATHKAPAWTSLFEDPEDEDKKKKDDKEGYEDDPEKAGDEAMKKKEKDMVEFAKFMAKFKEAMGDEDKKGEDDPPEDKKEMNEHEKVVLKMAEQALEASTNRIEQLTKELAAKDARLAKYEASNKEEKPSQVTAGTSKFEEAFDAAIKAGKTPGQAYAEAAKANPTEHIKHLDRVTVG